MTAAEGCNPADVLLGSAGSRAIVQASSKMTNSAFRSQPPRVTAHALHVGERINTAGFEKEALSAVPLALRAGGDGIAVLFRYGAVVFLNMTMEEEAAFLDRLLPRIGGRLMPPEEESATVELLGETEDQVGSGGPVHVRDMSMARLLVVSDVLAKSVVLAHDEREVAKVFETIEPFVRELASSGKFFRNRRGILRLIGEALLVQHNVSGRVAITDKPDALWDRPDLERLYARLEDEYELIGAGRDAQPQAGGGGGHRRYARRHHRHPPLAAARDHRRAPDRLRDRDRLLPDLRRARRALGGGNHRCGRTIRLPFASFRGASEASELWCAIAHLRIHFS